MVTFTRFVPGTYDASLGTYTGAGGTTITGNALQVKGDPTRYAALSLQLSSAPTLLFTPTDYNLRAFTDEFVLPGDTVSWNGVIFTVRDVDTVAPDGLVILSRIIVSV